MQFEMDSAFLDGPEINNDLSAEKAVAVSLCLEKLFHGQTYFSICDVDRLIEMMSLTLTMETRGAYNILRALHCVHYDKMSKEQVRMVKKMTLQVLNIQVVESERKAVNNFSHRADIEDMKLVSNGNNVAPVRSRLRIAFSNMMSRGKE